MRRFSSSTYKMILGAAFGITLAALIGALVVAGGLNFLGFLIVLILMAVTLAFGWILGYQSRVRERRQKLYDEGYRQGVIYTAEKVRNSIWFPFIKQYL